jgi:hypothetical protein
MVGNTLVQSIDKIVSKSKERLSFKFIAATLDAHRVNRVQVKFSA